MQHEMQHEINVKKCEMPFAIRQNNTYSVIIIMLKVENWCCRYVKKHFLYTIKTILEARYIYTADYAVNCNHLACTPRKY